MERPMNKFLALTLVVLSTVLSTLSLTATSAQASTIGQREALGAAKDYLSFQAFSRAGLIHQLESPYGDLFSHANAVGASTTPTPTGTPRPLRLPRRT